MTPTKKTADKTTNKEGTDEPKVEKATVRKAQVAGQPGWPGQPGAAHPDTT